MSIIESRNQYKKDRQEQKRIIVEKVLIPLGLTATMQGGAGKSNYTSNNTTAPFDLSYWLWVDGKINGKTAVTIYLQSFDRDPSNKNYHILMDRISVQMNNGDIIRTDVDLPLDDNKICKLKEFISGRL